MRRFADLVFPIFQNSAVNEIKFSYTSIGIIMLYNNSNKNTKPQINNTKHSITTTWVLSEINISKVEIMT